MRGFTLCLVSFLVIFGSWFQSVSSQNVTKSDIQQAAFPPRGWNSYDAFSWIISEEEFLQNAELVSQRLLAHGYEYVVVDYLWYRKKVPGAHSNSLGFDVIDQWGRMAPDPVRWPSSKSGNGFTEIAKKVHSLGLKFGIHIMAGISTQAVNANTPILDTTTGAAYQESGRVWHAKDIAIQERRCGWMTNGFMSVNTTLGAGKAFLRSLHEQYAAWGVDLVKHDCVFGEDLDLNEITYESEVLSKVNRPLLYSLSPGVKATPDMAKQVSGLVNMYRIAGDDWDVWGDVKSHFNVSRDMAAANLIGAKGLKGNSWPDLDMLPFGWLTDAAVNDGPHRSCRLTLEEQRTQMTLWAMAKSPLMYGGDVRKIDNATYEIITNPTLLEINHFSSNNKEFPYVTKNETRNQVKEIRSKEAPIQSVEGVSSADISSWIATGRKGEVYLAFFNLSEQKTPIYAHRSNLSKAFTGKRIRSCKGQELWSGKYVATKKGSISTDVGVHGCALFVLNCK
ncbi:alpha-galactosidase [Medicago truncatula]|uniref:Alpha-galactosidase n=1 Tax=Medicago truncatula TaxID=3880 RepID=A0A072TTA9_MEDTR|nr:alpha-galactosidase [Medicago truncatula]